MVGGRLIAVCVGCTLPLAPVVVAQPAFSTSHGIQFSTIGDPGNPTATEHEAPGFFPPFWNPVGIHVGRVDFEYRLARTEVTVGQYLEFVRAYAPYWTGSPGSLSLTGTWIVLQAGGGYAAAPGSEDLAANMTWHNAARFCNWLHNDKRTEAWAFENGAYDTSTFGPGPGGVHNEQPTRNPDARYWIPSLDEHVKGMNYDPDRYGPGEGGYWSFPNASDTPPVSGYPSDGGETSAGIPFSFAVEDHVPVGAYPHVQSPWGLLDGSGGESEWTEMLNEPGGFQRVYRGSWSFLQFYESWDRIDGLSASFPTSPLHGLRLAAAVPGVGPVGTLVFAAIALTRRKGR